MSNSSSSIVEYPDSDGRPIADNTLQFQWIVTVKENLEVLFAADPNVFVAGDLLWYPVEGQPKNCQAPDVLVAFGSPKGYRGSYRQWVEGDVAPQVVFEILSPGNRASELKRKFEFYDRYGVEEYYVFDPDAIRLSGWRREEDRLRKLADMEGYESPRLGVRFSLASGDLVISRPDGTPFVTFEELAEQRDRESRRADEESRRADEEARRADREARRAEGEALRAEGAESRSAHAELENARLRARLKALGEDVD